MKETADFCPTKAKCTNSGTYLVKIELYPESHLETVSLLYKNVLPQKCIICVGLVYVLWLQDLLCGKKCVEL